MTKKEKKGERQKQLEEKPYFGEATGTPGGRSGGNLAREIGTRDDLKRAFERPASKTRVRKSDDENGS